ncbi:hypothetical protein HanIR_Chr07g0331681 [Helianthus annuus]|nr:hypothetical protein HanIR_Chr07g0331681 [Helianthus annuus]
MAALMVACRRISSTMWTSGLTSTSVPSGRWVSSTCFMITLSSEVLKIEFPSPRFSCCIVGLCTGPVIPCCLGACIGLIMEFSIGLFLGPISCCWCMGLGDIPSSCCATGLVTGPISGCFWCCCNWFVAELSTPVKGLVAVVNGLVAVKSGFSGFDDGEVWLV